MKKLKSYCCYCGEKISRKQLDDRLRDFCEKCSVVFYENPLPVASSIVVNENREVLLVKRKNDPYAGMWCLPIGFAESGEEVSQAALRELTEETGLKGEIIRLIDVDTVENYFYGSLAIVAYEVKTIGGKLEPGDDATDTAYFPLNGLPELAWSSNEKALGIFEKIHSDEWAMTDSFKQLFPESSGAGHVKEIPENTREFLSNVMVRLIGMDMDEINSRWLSDVHQNVPVMDSYIETIKSLNKMVLRDVRSWLKGDDVNYDNYIKAGRKFKNISAGLPDILTAG